jgi:hypothetical protein
MKDNYEIGEAIRAGVDYGGDRSGLAAAIGRYCPDQTPVLTSAARPR